MISELEEVKEFLKGLFEKYGICIFTEEVYEILKKYMTVESWNYEAYDLENEPELLGECLCDFFEKNRETVMSKIEDLRSMWEFLGRLSVRVLKIVNVEDLAYVFSYIREYDEDEMVKQLVNNMDVMYYLFDVLDDLSGDLRNELAESMKDFEVKRSNHYYSEWMNKEYCGRNNFYHILRTEFTASDNRPYLFPRNEAYLEEELEVVGFLYNTRVSGGYPPEGYSRSDDHLRAHSYGI